MSTEIYILLLNQIDRLLQDLESKMRQGRYLEALDHIHSIRTSIKFGVKTNDNDAKGKDRNPTL